MNTVTTILLVIAGILALILIIALFMRRNHFVRREIIINTPSQKAFNYLRMLKNQDEFNKHAMAAADRQREFKGTDGTVGFVYSWRGDKSAGVGEKEILNIEEGKKIEAEIRFVKPMKAVAQIVIETDPISDNQTKVSWSNSGKLGYPVNFMIPMMEKHVKKDMDESLLMLKDLLEK